LPQRNRLVFVAGLLVFGVIVGLVSGMLGIGGGVVLVPGLMLLFGFSQLEAQGTSLAIVPVGIFAAMVYYQSGLVRLPIVGLIALGFVTGAYLGARLVPHLPIESLRLVFGALLVYIGFVFVTGGHSAKPAFALPAAIAALITFLVGLVVRRYRVPPHPPEPPTADREYFI
ncbi:MAG TPA: sulfite exporter TauE/SafE family protein, partial [Pirellulales bacterium]|nr:sulfite exporter TauE/SafE family protein [Pirellulales bacterium]